MQSFDKGKFFSQSTKQILKAMDLLGTLQLPACNARAVYMFTANAELPFQCVPLHRRKEGEIDSHLNNTPTYALRQSPAYLPH